MVTSKRLAISAYTINLKMYVIYMVRSVSGQEEPNSVIGYRSGQDGAILPARDFPLCSASK